MPERTCVCCRKKGEKENFFRLAEKDNGYIFDEKMKIQNRGLYICRAKECIEKLSKHKRYRVDVRELLKMLEELKKEKKNIIDIIRPMKNSQNFIFGIDENIEGIKRKKVKLLILPKNINDRYIQIFKKLKNEFKINIIMIEKKEELLPIFSREVNVVGITEKKVINGILNKVEVKDENI